MSNKYSIDQKKKLAENIQKITKSASTEKRKEYGKIVKKIITNNNPDLEFTKNRNGLMSEFHNLTLDTYNELTKFVSKIKKEQKKKLESELEDIELETECMTDEPVNRQKGLTNAEAQLLNKIKYRQQIGKDKNSSDDESSEIDVFSKKADDSDSINSVPKKIIKSKTSAKTAKPKAKSMK